MSATSCRQSSGHASRSKPNNYSTMPAEAQPGGGMLRKPRRRSFWSGRPRLQIKFKRWLTWSLIGEANAGGSSPAAHVPSRA